MQTREAQQSRKNYKGDEGLDVYRIYSDFWEKIVSE
jgi:hypothetical protein